VEGGEFVSDSIPGIGVVVGGILHPLEHRRDVVILSCDELVLRIEAFTSVKMSFPSSASPCRTCTGSASPSPGSRGIGDIPGSPPCSACPYSGSGEAGEGSGGFPGMPDGERGS
jgi:hypothetical protein